MKIETGVEDVLKEIEFELAQGAVSRDDLGKAVQQVRQFHGKLRAEIYGAQAPVLDVREIVNRQFQLNDMMLTLLQEVSAELHQTRLQMGRMRLTSPSGQTRNAPNPAPASNAMVADLPAPTWDDETVHALQATRDTKLEQKMDVRPVGVPIVGGLLSKLRAALHEVALFYVNRLAIRQSKVNGVYGEELLRLKHKTDRHDEQIRVMAAKIDD